MLVAGDWFKIEFAYENRTKLATGGLALFVTTTAISMASVAGWERGGSTIDRALLLSLSVSICIGTHLIPALSKNKLAWLLWFGCLLCAIFAHLTFFTNASFHASEVRAQSSSQLVGARDQIDAVRNALVEIKARPVTVVAYELATTNDVRLRSALRLELNEAKRSAVLRDDLVRLSATAETAKITHATDPVIILLSAVTGSSDSSITLVIGLCFAILLELVGALLWFEVLSRPGSVTSDDSEKSDGSEPVTAVKDAVAAGLCKPTVAGIRVFMGCGQARAVELRR